MFIIRTCSALLIGEEIKTKMTTATIGKNRRKIKLTDRALYAGGRLGRIKKEILKTEIVF